MNLFVYTEKKTPRIDYIFQLMIEDIAGFSFQTTTDKEEFEKYEGPKIAYSNEAFPHTLVIPNARFLEGKEKAIRDLNFTMYRDVACPFAMKGSETFPFDIFSAGFYLVTRCEEYTNKSRDHHNRFPASESIAYKKGFIEKPVVNVWALELREKILSKFPELTCKTRKATIVSTIDVDQLYAIKARGVKRTAGRLFKLLLTVNMKGIIKTCSVLMLGKQDPFDTFDYILALNQQIKQELIFFMHLGDYGLYDKSIRWNHSAMQHIIHKILPAAFLGIHPSYSSNSDPKRLSMEIQRFEQLTKDQPEKSRQHYLKMSFPATYENLIAEGIASDYTMGYSECIGFRASICTPFKFYNLELEQERNLMVYPFAAMDRALKDGMRLSVEESIVKIKKMMSEVKSMEGVFISLFHNESLSENKEWKGWRTVYENIVLSV